MKLSKKPLLGINDLIITAFAIRTFNPVAFDTSLNLQLIYHPLLLLTKLKHKIKARTGRLLFCLVCSHFFLRPTFKRT